MKKERGKCVNGRIMAVTVLVALIISGLVAGLFMGAIQKALTLPVMQAMMTGGRTTVPLMPSPTATAIVQKPTNILAQDTYNRGNQPLWGTASDGRAWGGDANAIQAFSIVNATGQIAHSQGTLNAVLGPAGSNMDVTLNGMITRFAGGANIGAVVRWTNANNWYKAFIDGAHLVLLRRVNGTSVQLASVPFKAQGGTFYTIRLRVVGATLFTKVWRSGTIEPARWMITLTDKTLASGQPGLRVVMQNGIVINVISFIATAM